MRLHALILTALVVLAFGLGTTVQPSLARESGHDSDNVFKVLFGEGRRMFANHFAVKADVYLHSGMYPSIFDKAAGAEENDAHDESEEHVHGPDCDHSQEDEQVQAHEDHESHDDEDSTGLGGHECDTSFLGKPRDWFEAMGRNFMVTEHSHLSGGKEREILPWLEISADLDPQRIETYLVAGYWLANRMDRPKEAEQFLRRGLRANPQSYEILFELGGVYQRHLNDPERARNVWLLALRRWDEVEANKEEPDKVGRNKILGQLAESYLESGHYADAINYFEQAKQYSSAPEAVDMLIQEIRARSSQQESSTAPFTH